MNQPEQTIQQEYRKVSEMLYKLIEPDYESMEKIGVCIQNYGFQIFLNNFEELNLPEELSEKLLALKDIIFELTENGGED